MSSPVGELVVREGAEQDYGARATFRTVNNEMLYPSTYWKALAVRYAGGMTEVLRLASASARHVFTCKATVIPLQAH